MQQFKAVFTNELGRVFRKRKTIVFCIISILIITLYSLLSTSYISISGAISYIGNLHSVFFLVVFPLYIFMETIDIFTEEMSSLTIHNVLVRPVTRTKIYLAKICAVCAFMLIQIVFAAVFGAVFSIFMGGGVISAIKNIAAYVITFIPIIAFVFMAAFISQIVKNGLLGMVLCIFFLLVSYLAEVFSPIISTFLFVRHINLYKMILTGNIQLTGIFSALLIIVAYIGVTFTAGALIFEKKEF